MRTDEINTTVIKYGVFEGSPVRYTDVESWIFDDNHWREWTATGEILANAHVLTKAAFEASYPNLPSLPASAFAAKT